MKYWVTKWYLTQGILELDLAVAVSSPDYLTGVGAGGWRIFVKLGVDAFESEKEAKARARRLVDAKLKALDTSRTRLVGLRKKLEDA